MQAGGYLVLFHGCESIALSLSVCCIGGASSHVRVMSSGLVGSLLGLLGIVIHLTFPLGFIIMMIALVLLVIAITR